MVNFDGKNKADQPVHDNMPCIVCASPSPVFFLCVNGYRYLRCRVCHATFLHPEHRPAIEDEHDLYRKHRNDPYDKGYRRFLSRLASPLMERLPPQANGLDYGCGPGPALAYMLREAGHRVQLFDPLFFPNPRPFEDLYDFIVCAEVVEHFHRPAEEFARLDKMLLPGGQLAIMTCFQTDDNLFANWHYRRDPTHVVFFRETTLRCIARRFQWHCDIPAKDVVLMQKPNE